MENEKSGFFYRFDGWATGSAPSCPKMMIRHNDEMIGSRPKRTTRIPMMIFSTHKSRFVACGNITSELTFFKIHDASVINGDDHDELMNGSFMINKISSSIYAGT